MKRSLPPDFAHSVDAVVIGASAGGIDALLTVLGGMQAPFRGSVIVVLHLPETRESRLAQVFATRLGLPTEEAQCGAPVSSGRIFFAPPGYHLLVEADRTFALSCDAPVLFSRPSIDVLFESCADAYGSGLAAMVLTGANQDGAAGLARIKKAGGLTAAQEPAEAMHDIMPRAAIAAATPDYILPLAGLRSLLHTVVR